MKSLRCNGQKLNLERVAVMGILNVTPDSFFDGGLFVSVEKATQHARLMVEGGAAIIDVGGESTRPGAQPVSVDDEYERVIPVIKSLRSEIPIPISVDTSKPEIMEAAVSAGACMINDVRALRAPGALETAARLNVSVCLMHMKGEPRTMQQDPVYDDVVLEVQDFLKTRIQACLDAGITADHIVVDPGFGFGKSVAHNLTLLRRLQELKVLDHPLLAGLSRKSMIGMTLDLPVDKRVHASVALALMAVQNGADMIRVHDVGPTVEAVRMFEAVYRAA